MSDAPKPYTLADLDRELSPYGGARGEALAHYMGDLDPYRTLATVEAVEKAEAELAEVQGIARESMARFDELHSMLKEAKAERDERTEQFRRAARIANELTLETQTPEEWTADLVRQVRQARAERDEWKRAAEARPARLQRSTHSRRRAHAEGEEVMGCGWTSVSDTSCLECGLFTRPCECERAKGAPRVFTRAEVLAFGERVREACAKVVGGCAVDESPSAPNYLDDVADMLRAVDVARLLDSGD